MISRVQILTTKILPWQLFSSFVVVVRHRQESQRAISSWRENSENSFGTINCLIILSLSMFHSFKKFLTELKQIPPACSDIAREVDFEER